MARLRLLLAAVPCAMMVAAGAAPPAHACSCAGGSPTERLARNDIAFLGTVASRRAVDPEAPPGLGSFHYVIRVERTYKGSLPAEIEVTISASGPSCGFQPEVGRRIGLLLDDAKPYGAGICNLTSAEELERATRPPPPPLGRGRVALLAAGPFGERSTVAALDRRGRVLAYGFGVGGSALSVCPGSRRFVQAGADLVVRRMRDLRVLSRRRLPVAAVDVRCLDGAARAVVVSAMHDTRTRSAAGVVLLGRGRTRVLARGTQPYAFLGRRRAVVTGGTERAVRVSVVDYATGRTRRVLRTTGFPVGLALDPRERVLALVEADDDTPATPIPPRLHVAELHTGRARSLALPSPRTGRVVWLSQGRFALLDTLLQATEEPAPIYDAAGLGVAGRLPNIEGGTAVRLGAAVVGVDTLGYLVRSAPGAAAPTRTAFLPTAGVRALAAVPGAPALRGAGRRLPAPARAATLNACSSPSPSRSAA